MALINEEHALSSYLTVLVVDCWRSSSAENIGAFIIPFNAKAHIGYMFSSFWRFLSIHRNGASNHF